MLAMVNISNRNKVFLLSWIIYATYYLGKVNISIAIPAISLTLSLSKSQIGIITGLFFVSYAIGQLINGALGDSIDARIIVGAGAIFSGIINYFFGVSNSYLIMAFLWFLNGYFQSMGWAPSVKILASWFSRKEVGKVTGAFSTSYEIGNVLSWILAGFLLVNYGWKFVFYIPALVLITTGIMYIRLMEHSLKSREEIKIRHRMRLLLNKKVLLFALTFLLVDGIRYSLTIWIPTFLFEKGLKVSSSVLLSIFLPLFSSIGAILSGYISDEIFNKSRAKPVILMLAIFSLSTTFLLSPFLNKIMLFLIISLIGFSIGGPDALLASAVPIDIGGEKFSASIAGFLDFSAYIGASISVLLSSIIIDKLGWAYFLYFLIMEGVTAIFTLICTRD